MSPPQMEDEQDEPIDETWMTTYADMVTLLMTFFVMLMSASTVDVVLFEQIKAGMAKGMGSKDAVRPIEMMRSDLSDDIQNLDIGETVSLGVDSQGIVLEFASAAFYDLGTAKIREEAKPILNRLSGTLKADRYKDFIFEVRGHTDDSPIQTEKFPSNWELSSGRATAVVRLLARQGIDKTRLRAIGFADSQPKVPNRDPYGRPIPGNRELNRRIEIRIEPRRNM